MEIEVEKRKEFYREKIIKMVAEINRTDILEYLFVFISGKLKGEKEDEE